MRRLMIVIGFLSIGFAAACGGATEATPSQSSTGGEQTTGPEGPAAWSAMNHEQRATFMKETVMPEMQQLFQEHDAERYAEFGCKTCHGENAKEVGFAMPNGIAPLDPAGVGEIFQSDEPMAQLMTQRVWPRMAELLGEQQFNPETGEGFSCFNCHGKKGE